MANPIKGEVALVAGEKTYNFRLSANTLVEMEDHFGGKSFNEIMEDMGSRPSIKGLRTVVWFALSENDPAPDEKEAGRIIDAAGMTAINEALKKAIEITFPPRKESEEENPQTAADGTGKGS